MRRHLTPCSSPFAAPHLALPSPIHQQTLTTHPPLLFTLAFRCSLSQPVATHLHLPLSPYYHPSPSTSHHPLPIIHHPSPITHYPLSITHHPSPITHYPSPITHQPSTITHHPSLISHHPSPITHHPSPITHHPSPITHHPSPTTPDLLSPVELSCISIFRLHYSVGTSLFYMTQTRYRRQMGTTKGGARLLSLSSAERADVVAVRR
jgi:hypothetical protein